MRENLWRGKPISQLSDAEREEMDRHMCWKRDFHSNMTLAERVQRLERAVFFNQEERNRLKSRQIAAETSLYNPKKAATPIDLLRELRAGFEAEAEEFRDREQRSTTMGNERVFGAKAYVAEQAVKKIDATLRDWA